ncbi:MULTISPECIES: flagellar hook-basal body complex protein [Marinomonas]|uniref:Flagellar hook protein FlgE n=1 Tax=Marinomonas arctica TaxID=383750 RepID=A0A7H1J3Q7_9GAMM|nr:MULTISPECIES: flagellar hook-basal body complex protein [Marinomonas]MCS7486999.1 flagellar hook-basal body protein [Marinomonas sp. BSi20414]QNT05123.1 flagellar hook-basal body complex protein [Marinomonas arctica]GGN15962.1 flagellar hook protein FlgE [Marinomonas arctica]
MGFNTALSGIKASADYLGVTGNNIANADTTGFKKSRIEFDDLYNTSVLGAGSGNSIGSGVSVSKVSQEFSSGNLAYTDNNLDLAIDGSGFFVLDAGIAQSYTRAGNFKLDENGFLVTNTGSNVQGFNAVDGIVGGNLEDMKVPTDRIPPEPTTEMGLKVNLDSKNKDIPPFIKADFDPMDPDTYNYTQTQGVVDGNGQSHIVTYYYAKSELPNTYKVHATVDGNLTDDTGAAFLGETYATYNSAEAGIDFNGDGTEEPPFELLYIGATEPGVADIEAATKNPLAIAGTLGGVAINSELVPEEVRKPSSVARETFDPLDPDTYNYGNTRTVYDSLGEPHTMGYYFIKQGENNTYELRVTMDGEESYVDPLTGEETMFLDKNTSVSFDAAGNLLGTYRGIPPFGVPEPITLEIMGVDPTNRGRITPLDLTGSTQFALDNTDNFEQDGFSAGELQGVSFDSDGFLMANYTNQQTATLGQIALASFDSTDGLMPSGHTSWLASKGSGPADIGRPNSGTFGKIQGGALEESNVDLTSELVALIEAQRNYQANSKTLETENTVTQTIINLR